MKLVLHAQQNELLDTQFLDEVSQLEPLYNNTIDGAKSEMMLVGKIGEFKRHYVRQSREWKFYQHILDELGIDKDKVSRLTTAYNYYHKLKGKQVEEYEEVAETASPNQLYALKKAGEEDNSTTLYDAAKYLKKEKKLPSISKINKRATGRLGSDFKENVETFQQTQSTDVITPEVVEPTEPEAVIEVQNTEQKIQEVFEDPTKPALDDPASARAYISNTGFFPQAKAFLQMMRDRNYLSSDSEGVVREIERECRDLLQRAWKSRVDPTRVGEIVA